MWSSLKLQARKTKLVGNQRKGVAEFCYVHSKEMDKMHVKLKCLWYLFTYSEAQSHKSSTSPTLLDLGPCKSPIFELLCWWRHPPPLQESKFCKDVFCNHQRPTQQTLFEFWTQIDVRQCGWSSDKFTLLQLPSKPWSNLPILHLKNSF